MSERLKEIEENLRREGMEEGSFPYKAELRKRKVELCKTQKSVDSCWSCSYFDYCELVKEHLRDLRFHKQIEKEPDG